MLSLQKTDKEKDKSRLTFDAIPLRFSTRTGARKLIYIIGIMFVGLFIIWQYRASVKSNQYSILDVKLNDDVFRNYTFLTFEHAKKLKSRFGRKITIEYLGGIDERDVKSGITLSIVRPSLPENIEFTDSRSIYKAPQNGTGYVRVSHYWEQISMNTRSLITLAGQAKIGNRKVLAPRVKNSWFGRNGYFMGTYYNMTHFNKVLALGDYATLISEADYEAECSLADPSHVAMHFLYVQKKEATKKNLHLNEKQYSDISKTAGKIGWTECPTLENYIKLNSNAKFFCVNISKVTEWSVLENKVIKGAKCLTLSSWSGIGSRRSHFSQKHLKFQAKDLQFALKPSGIILKEVNRFRRMLYGPYIAVHVRGEKIFTTHSLSRLKSCLHVLDELVKVLKAVSGISQVLIASDMSSFGSGAWKDFFKGGTDHQPLRELQSFLLSSTGGIQYTPTADDVDRGVVALVEMTLLARAKHLITVGKGTFQEWIEAKFLEQHREDNYTQWSLIKMCSD